MLDSKSLSCGEVNSVWISQPPLKCDLNREIIVLNAWESSPIVRWEEFFLASKTSKDSSSVRRQYSLFFLWLSSNPQWWSTPHWSQGDFFLIMIAQDFSCGPWHLKQSWGTCSPAADVGLQFPLDVISEWWVMEIVRPHLKSLRFHTHDLKFFSAFSLSILTFCSKVLNSAVSLRRLCICKSTL